MSTPVPTVFICMPLTADSEHTIEQHIENAKLVARKVLELGGYPICPHTNTGWMFGNVLEEEEQTALLGLHRLGAQADIFFCPKIKGFSSNENSKGCLEEEFARLNAGKDSDSGSLEYLKICINVWKETH